MKRERESRWFWVVAAFPVGGFVGYTCGFYLAFGILSLQGKGNSHNDMFTIVFSGVLGAGLGAVLLSVLTWFFRRNRPK